MPITFQCPQCGKKLKAPDSAVGKSSKCPGCGGTVICPEPVYDAEVVEMTMTPEKPPGFNPYADLDDDNPYAMVNPPAAEESTIESRRPCPMCGEMILATAVKCRYCNEVFDPTLKKAKSKKKSKNFSRDDEVLSGGEIAAAVLCSNIGCIAGLIWMIQGKPKGLKMLGLSFGMQIVWGVVGAVVKELLKTGGP
jgi:predicted RNA-binding Zn-ribbon protein involved in translation (DUF1610 family)